MRSSGKRVLPILLWACASSVALAQNLTISPQLIEAQKAFTKDNVREGGTVPEDWRFELPPGVTCKQITFYSDDTAAGGKIFYPKGFDKSKKYPGVVCGHGTNGIAVGIEKYGAKFAEYGIVTLVMDYRGYGYSDGWVRLDEADDTTDDKHVTEKTARIVIKRTRLLTPKQFEDYRSAISYLQGEPGVDPEKIGIWGSSLSAGTVMAVAGSDARVKAVVAQVGGGSTPTARRPTPTRMNEAATNDAIKRAREGQGAEQTSGFSVRTKTDIEQNVRNAELRTGWRVNGMPKTTAILFLPAENDELTRGAAGVVAAAKVWKDRGNPCECVVLPHTTHFQGYTGPAFEMSGPLAAEWFAHYLKTN